MVCTFDGARTRDHTLSLVEGMTSHASRVSQLREVESMIDVYGQIAACYVKRRALYQLSYEGLCRDDNGHVSVFVAFVRLMIRHWENDEPEKSYAR